jgi:hypothetical protein
VNWDNRAEKPSRSFVKVQCETPNGLATFPSRAILPTTGADADLAGERVWEIDDLVVLVEQSYCLVLIEEDAETPIDVLAWSIREPDVFGTLLGQAAIAGVDSMANPPSCCSGPCPLWQTPLRWLQEGCRGGIIHFPPVARHRAGQPSLRILGPCK